MHFNRAGWNTLPAETRDEIAGEAAAVLREMEAGEQYQSAAFSLLGHKGDLLFIHFRESLNDLNAAELRLSGLRLSEFLEPATSYLSVVELGLYESTARLYASLQEKGIEPGSAEWTKAVEETLERPAHGHGAPSLSHDPRVAIRLLLPDGPHPGRIKELVSRAAR